MTSNLTTAMPAETANSRQAGVEQQAAARDERRLSERLVQRIGRAASAEAVFGQPVAAHGRTVVPVARTYFALGAGGGWGEGKAGQREPGLGRAAGEGGGAGGAGWTVASGYIELSPEGTRYVAFSDRGTRVLGAVAGLLLGLALSPFLRR